MGVDAGTIYSEVRIKLDKLKGDVAGIESSFNKLGKNVTGGLDNTAKSAEKSFDQINLAGVAAFAGITLAVKNSIKTFATFEQSLLNVKSVSGATAEEFQKIEDAAREAGETTRFTASEAADALYFLASAGFDATQSVQALDGVLTLAGATQADLAFTSETVAAAISQFNLEAEDAGRVANTFAASIQNSQATIEKMSAALRQAGPIAGQLGVSIEETSASLQALFKAGLRGEQAGTVIRNILLDLSDSSGSVSSKLIALGLDFDKFNPKTVGLSQAMQYLGESGQDLASIFGKETATGVTILAKTATSATENLNDLEKAVTGTNAAAEAYAIQNEGLLASFDFLKSAAQEASISFTEEVSPALKLLTDLITGFLRIISKLPGPIKTIIASFIIAIPVLIGVTTAIGALSTAIGALSLSLSGLVAAGAIISGVAIGIKSVSDTLAELDATSTVDELIKVEKAGEKATGSLKLLQNRIELLGLTADSFKALRAETGKTGIELVRLANTIKRGFDLTSPEKLTQGIKVLSKESGVAADALLRLIVLSDNFSESEKNIAQTLLEQNIALEEQEKHKENIKKSNEEIADESSKILQLEKNINEAVEAGILTEEEGLNQKIKLRQDVIGALQKEAIEQGNTSQKIQDELKNNLGALQAYKKELEETQGTEKAIDSTEEYIRKLAELDGQTKTAIESERERAIETVQGFNASEDATRNALEALNDYYDALQDDTSNAEFLSNLKTTATATLGAISQLFGAIDGLQQVVARNRIEALNRELEAQLAAIDAQTQAKLEALGLVEETELETLERQLEEAIAIGDESTANDIQNNITKLEIEKEADAEKTAIKEEAARREAQIEYQAELQSWKLTLAQTVANGIGAVVATYNNAGGFPFGVVPAAIMTGVYTKLLQGVQKSKPQPPGFETGGLVIPGGAGGTQITVAENNAPELMLNGGAEGQAFLKQFARSIAQEIGVTGGGYMNITFETDGLKTAQGVVKYINNGNVRVQI